MRGNEYFMITIYIYIFTIYIYIYICMYKPWEKKELDSSFDATMGSYDGAELCGLIGIYIQSLLESSLEKNQMGLH